MITVSEKSMQLLGIAQTVVIANSEKILLPVIFKPFMKWLSNGDLK